MIRYVPASEVAEIWPEVKPLAGIFAERSLGCYALDDVLLALVLGKWDLWVAEPQGHVTTMMLGWAVAYPRRKVYELFGLVGANMREWLEWYPVFEEWVRAHRGCSMVIPTAPHAWARLLRPHGFEKSHVVLAKEIA